MRSVLIFLTEISMFATILLRPSHSAVAAANTGNAFRFFQGTTVTCDREGEIINTTISDSQCFKCVCRAGIPECKQKTCADLSTCPLKEPKRQGECCEKCKTCNYVGQTYENNDQWFSDQDPCRRFACKSGVVTEGTIECIVRCSNPVRKPGICCPLCPSEAIVDFPLEHSCVKCVCQRFTSWYNNPLSFVASHEVSDEKQYCHCFRTPCPILDCPKEKRYTPEGSCCEECITTQLAKYIPSDDCVFRGERIKNSQLFRPDICALCVCREGTVQCQRFMCKLPNCTASRVYYRPDLCCPLCLDRDPLPCTYQNKEYKHGKSWSVNSCTTCSCSNSQINCTTTQCPFERGCPRGYRMIPAAEGQCCQTCKEYEATCTVYGDPHYQTFDGRQYNFQGSCKYILTKTCGGTSSEQFSVIVKNEPLGYNWSTWTRQVAIRLPNFRIVLLPGKRVKINHTLLNRIPFIELGKFSITFDRHKNLAFNYVHGLKVKWDGNSYVEVTISRAYRKSMCGLCGNYNGDPQDDFQLQSTQPWRYGSSKNAIVGDADIFARSWRTGSWEKCRNPVDRNLHQAEDRAKRKYRRQMAQLRRSKYGRLDSEHSSPIFESRPKFSDVINSPSILTMTNYAVGKRRSSSPSEFSARPIQNKKKPPLPQLPDADLWNVLLNRLKVKRDKSHDLTKKSTFDSPPMMNDDSKIKLNAKNTKKRLKRRRMRNLARKMCRNNAEPKRWNAALKNCKLLKSKFFEQCHDYVDFKSFYNSCIMDVCSCQPFAKCYCESLSAYTAQCENRNVTVTWKDTGCSVASRGCTVEGSIFELCPPACEQLTCENFLNSAIKACHEKYNSPNKSIIAVGSICSPSCRCPEGKVISRRKNKCVNVNQC